MIWKYKLEYPITDLTIPCNAKALTVGEQDGIVVLWIQLDPMLTTIKRRFVVRMTGHYFEHQTPDDYYIGTVQIRPEDEPEFVAHVYEVAP